MVLRWLGTENPVSCQQVSVLPSFFEALSPGLAVAEERLKRWSPSGVAWKAGGKGKAGNF